MLAGLVVEVTDDGDHLNRMVYDFLVTRLLDAAVAAAMKQVDLAPGQANPYDTLAEALYAADDRKQAVAMSQKAVELAKDETQRAGLKDNLARFSAPASEPRSAPDVERTRERLERRYQTLTVKGPGAARAGHPGTRSHDEVLPRHAGGVQGGRRGLRRGTARAPWNRRSRAT